MSGGRKAKPWFRAQRFVWGWYPARVQGWFVLLFYLAVILYGSWVLLPRRPEHGDPMRTLLWLSFVTMCILSLVLVVWRTGGRPIKRNNPHGVETPTKN